MHNIQKSEIKLYNKITLIMAASVAMLSKHLGT